MYQWCKKVLKAPFALSAGRLRAQSQHMSSSMLHGFIGECDICWALTPLPKRMPQSLCEALQINGRCYSASRSHGVYSSSFRGLASASLIVHHHSGVPQRLISQVEPFDSHNNCFTSHNVEPKSQALQSLGLHKPNSTNSGGN